MAKDCLTSFCEEAKALFFHLAKVTLQSVAADPSPVAAEQEAAVLFSRSEAAIQDAKRGASNPPGSDPMALRTVAESLHDKMIVFFEGLVPVARADLENLVLSIRLEEQFDLADVANPTAVLHGTAAAAAQRISCESFRQLMQRPDVSVREAMPAVEEEVRLRLAVAFEHLERVVVGTADRTFKLPMYALCCNLSYAMQ